MSNSCETYVLVVEDEPLIRLTIFTFRKAGTLYSASNSPQALEAMYDMPDVHVL